MNYTLRRFFLVLFFSTIPLSTVWAQHTFTHPAYNYHLTLRDDWATANTTPRNLTFTHKSLPSTLNISVRSYPEYAQISDKNEAATALNEIISRQKISYFDGWQNLIERPGTPLEISSAGVLNSQIAVYSQTILMPDLSVDKIIVAEYYYMKPGLIYILSFQTLMSQWRTLQPEIKSFIDSFWIGTGERPQFSQNLVEATGWTMSGGNEKNNRIGDSLIQLDHTLASVWEAPIYTVSEETPSKNTPFVSLILADDLLVASAEKHIYAFTFDTGKLLWDYSLKAPILSPLAYGNDMIFFVCDEPEPALFYITPTDGNIIFKKKLATHFVSDVVYSNQSIYLIEGSTFSKMSTVTNKTIWTADQPFNFQWKPVLNKDLVFAITPDNHLIALTQNQGSIKWIEALPAGLLTAPLINGNYLAVVLDDQTQSKANADASSSDILLFDPTTGKKLRTLATPDSGRMIHAPIMDEKCLYALYKLTLDNSDLYTFRMIAYSLSDGKILWKKDILLPTDSKISQPIVSQSAIIFNQGLDQNRGIMALDRLSGAEILSPHRATAARNQIQELYGHHTSLILIQKNAQKINIKVIK